MKAFARDVADKAKRELNLCRLWANRVPSFLAQLSLLLSVQWITVNISGDKLQPLLRR